LNRFGAHPDEKDANLDLKKSLVAFARGSQALQAG
jgi:hypothetical protein